MSFEQISDLCAQAVALAACGVIFWPAEPALNRMCCRTFRLIYSAFYLLTVGAFGFACWILAGYVPAWPVIGLVVGVALLLVCERRVKIFMRLPKLPTKGGA